MKKILFIALALIASSTMYADKKCCKDKTGAKATACTQKSEAKASLNSDGTVAVDPANSSTSSTGHACCKKGSTAGKSCGGEKTASTSSTPTTVASPAPVDARPAPVK